MTNPEWLKAAARRSAHEVWMLGHVFEKYRELEGRSPEQLAVELGCSLEVLQWLSLCRRPEGDKCTEQVDAIVKRFALDPLRLIAVLRHVEAMDARRAPDGLPLRPSREAGNFVGEEDFRAAFGESLSSTLDLDTWDTGLDLEGVMARFKPEIASAVDREGQVRAAIRSRILPMLGQRPGAPAEAGVYKALPEELGSIHEGLLFPGRVEAVNGTAVSHDSLPLGITQLGIAVVSYGGTSGTFAQRLFRKEISSRSEDAFQEALSFIEMRQNPMGVGRGDSLSMLARRGIRTYAERAILMDKAEAEWRIGHGNPCAYELLSGFGSLRLLDASLRMLQRLIQHHKKFVFVPSSLEDGGFLMTIGYALDAGEYAIIETLERYGMEIVDGWHGGGRSQVRAFEFVKECCPDVLMGLFRASERSPPRVFYAHREYVHLAARVALADSILRSERGFPMLLDVAEVSCRAALGADGFLGRVHDTYAYVGANLQHFSGREMRR